MYLERHFNKKSLVEKITDSDFDKYKVSLSSKVYFDKQYVKRAFEVMLRYLREIPGVTSYNSYLEIEYKDNENIYYNMFQNMIDKENKEYEDLLIEDEEF